MSALDPEKKSLQRNDYIAAALTALIALLVYLRTLPPTFTGDDSAEFITAAYTLGFAHPPGYPLWCMLGKLFTLIVPYSNIAWRVAFMSAFFGAATCFVVSLIVCKLTRNRIAAVGSGAMLAVASEFWKWNVVAETYSLNAFLLALCILALLCWHDTRRPKYLYAFAAAYGLGLCNHHTMHFMGPVFAAFILFKDIRDCKDYRNAFPPRAGGLRGEKGTSAHSAEHPQTSLRVPQFLSRLRTYALMLIIAAGIWGIIHLYLPIRAMAEPYSNWGDPKTWENFWHVVLRKQYTRGFTRDARTLERFLEQMLVVGKHYSVQFTPYLAVLPALGIYPLWKRNRRALGLVLGAFVYVVIGLTYITNFGFDRESVWLNTKFYIPAYMMAAILTGVAVAWLASFTPRGKAVAIAAAAVMFVLPLTAHYRTNDKSDYYFARDFGINMLKTLDKDALYFPSTDHFIYPLFYLQAVEGLRPDVTIVTKFGYPEPEFYKNMPAALRGGNTGRIQTKVEKAAIEEWIVANNTRPSFFSRMRSLTDVDVVSAGLLYKAVPKGTVIPAVDYWSQYTWHTLKPEDARGDMFAEIVLAECHFARGRDFFNQGDNARALEEMAAAVSMAPTRIDLVNNVAAICSDHREWAAAETYLLKVLEVDPEYTIALKNLINIFKASERFAEARDLYKRTIAIDARMYGESSAYVAVQVNDMAGMELAMGRFEDARKHLAWALPVCQNELGPEHPHTLRVMSNLAIALRACGQVEEARKHAQRAIDTLTKLVGSDHPFTNAVRQGAFLPSGE